MRKLISNIEKELRQIGEQGVNTSNLGMLGELTDIYKDLYEAEKLKTEEGGSMRDYRGDYGRPMNYGRGYNENYNEGGYGEYRMYGRQDYGRGGYNRGGYENRMYEHIDQIQEGADRYNEGRDRYRHGDSEQRMHEGLDRLMYGVCMLVESAMDFAETPQEKEIIRKHIQKIKNV